MKSLFFMMIFFSLPVLAQNQRLPVAPDSLNQKTATPEGALALKDLIKKGLEYSPDLQKAQAQVRISDETFSQAESAILPTLDAKASAQNRKLALSSFGQAGTVRQNQYEAYLELQQPLYAGGAITSGLGAAKLEKQIAIQDLFIKKQAYLLTLISAYYDYSEARERLRQAQINRDFLKNYAGIAKNYASIGRTKSIDRLQAEANLASSESTVLENESRLESARNQLLQVIGVEDLTDEEFNILAQLEVSPIEPITLKQALEKAIQGNPELRKAEMEVKRQGYVNDLNLVEDRPRLSLNGTYGYVSPSREEWFEENKNTYTVGVNLTVPIFSGLSSLSKRRANADIKFQREKDLNLIQDGLRRSLSTAIETLERDFARIKSLKSAVELGRKAMDSALADYRRGLVSSTDVMQIQGTRFQSELQLLEVTKSYMKQVLSLRRDLGIELEAIYAK